ncbi:MAG TPA: sugar phosphate nucleotidyltransferase [Terriglobales bacterium]|nr:sugar phosphate nucleotidyltransferase [Terriglobales bacterium]
MNRRWGIIPAAGLATRIQPLAFSKELLPVGTRHEGATEHPRAVCEYLLERMLLAGVTHVCFVISPSKTDIMSYFGGRLENAAICYAIQQNPAGLCDAVFGALPFISPQDEVLVGLPDTIWFPVEGYTFLPDRQFSFLLFPVAQPELFDAVITDDRSTVQEIQVKQNGAKSEWVWGAFKLSGERLATLHDLWQRRGRSDQYFGTLVNAHLAEGGIALGIKRGDQYVDVGTVHGYREAVRLLSSAQLAYHGVER